MDERRLSVAFSRAELTRENDATETFLDRNRAKALAESDEVRAKLVAERRSGFENLKRTIERWRRSLNRNAPLRRSAFLNH
jgi:phage regulator Rha-like protein